MSRYLIDRIQAVASMDIRLNCQIVLAEGDNRIEALVVADSAAGEKTRLRAKALFVLTGGVPLTAGVAGWLRRDRQRFVMTGSRPARG
jgi:thioredoxin reductase (NADPH)